MSALFDFVQKECFLEPPILSLAGGQAGQSLKKVFGQREDVTLNIITLEHREAASIYAGTFDQIAGILTFVSLSGHCGNPDEEQTAKLELAKGSGLFCVIHLTVIYCRRESSSRDHTTKCAGMFPATL